jgi:hypothetical protein
LGDEANCPAGLIYERKPLRSLRSGFYCNLVLSEPKRMPEVFASTILFMILFYKNKPTIVPVKTEPIVATSNTLRPTFASIDAFSPLIACTVPRIIPIEEKLANEIRKDDTIPTVL